MFNKQHMIRLRRWLRVMVIGGGVVSVAINMLHAGINGNQVAIGLSVLPPILVLVPAEVMGRTPVDPKWPWHKKYVRPFVMIGIAGGGAWLSYWAQSGAIMHYTDGNYQEAHILPLLVDGFMIIMSYTIYQVSERLMAVELAERSRDAKAAGTTSEPVRRRKDIGARERVAVLLSQNPEMSARDIADRVGISANYASTLRKELRAASDSELVSA